MSGDKQGPDLKGVTTRRTKDWLHEFINAPAQPLTQRVIRSRLNLFKKFPPTVMPDQTLTPDTD